MSARLFVSSVGLMLCLTSAALAQSSPAKDKEATKPPQVRTYSTVTVVDDPAKAPRLPTKGPVNPPTRPAELREPTNRQVEPKDDVRPTNPGQLREGLPGQARTEAKEHRPDLTQATEQAERRIREAIRQELRATAKELRDNGKRDESLKAPTEPRQIDQKPRPQIDKATRAPLRERLGRDN